MQNERRSSHRQAFTLVELLVVIGIIAVLISILLPSLARARDSANTVACLSNLRQIGMGALMYAQDNKGKLPIPWFNGDAYVTALGGTQADKNWWRTNWHHRVLPYMGKSDLDVLRATNNAAFYNLKNEGPMFCPAALPLPEASASYGMNGCIGAQKDSANIRNRNIPDFSINRIKSQTGIILYGDENTGASDFLSSSDGVNFNVYPPTAPDGVTGCSDTRDNYNNPVGGYTTYPDSVYTVTSCISFRHSGKKFANVVYVDGHAGSLTIEEARYFSTATAMKNTGATIPASPMQHWRWWSKAYPVAD